MAGVLVAAGLLAAACSSSGSGTNSSSGGSTQAGTTVTISNEAGQLWTCGFNPYNGSTTGLSAGFVYEPLVFINPLQNGKTTPMLATSWKWGAGNKSLTFTIRQGVKFNDGTPMTPADVVFTFNLLKKFPALDLPGDWGALSSVSATGSDQVTLNFKQAAVPYFYYVADQTVILPQHIWSKIANPVTFTNPHPVGTGPYMVNPCTHANITYTANPKYWQPGLPHVTKVQYPAFTSNNTANDQLANGQAQWGSQYIPAIKEFYTSKSPDFHYWFPPTVNVSLVPNLKNPILANVKVRQAMSMAPASSRRPSLTGWTSRWPASTTTATTRPRPRRSWPRPASSPARTASWPTPRARSWPSTSSTSVTTPTGSPRCRSSSRT
jgi:peptide/nickel transport system substrate-binding protein